MAWSMPSIPACPEAVAGAGLTAFARTARRAGTVRTAGFFAAGAFAMGFLAGVGALAGGFGVGIVMPGI